MAITTLSMVLTVFVLNLHHVTDRPVPGWAKKLVLVYLARLMCMCTCDFGQDAEEGRGDDKKNKYRVTPNSLGKAIGNQIGLLASLNGTLGSPPGPGRPDRSGRGPGGGGHTIIDQHGVHYRSQYTYGFEEKQNVKDPKKLEEEWAKDWKHLAEVVDRLFFWIFLSAIVVTTLLLFHPLTKAYFSLLGDESLLNTDKEPSDPLT